MYCFRFVSLYFMSRRVVVPESSTTVIWDAFDVMIALLVG